MSECSVELRQATKTFTTKRGANLEDVLAVRGLSLSIEPGEFFTLLGPSGCGKTTTLRLIAGFETPTSGDVFIQGKLMNKVPPYQRPVNTVFQNYALFPHLTVLKNVAFGMAVKRVPRVEREKLAQQALELVQLGDMGDRKPSQLSGGQQQRVALARALVNKPGVLLLDEPLGALDLKLRKAMQIELKQLQMQVGITFIYVTHDQEEALTMSDRVAVMHKGVLQQCGTPHELYEKPVNQFVADFIGESNFIKAKVYRVSGNEALVSVGREYFSAVIGEPQPQAGQEITISVRPEKIVINAPDASAHQGGLGGLVEQVIYVGADTRYVINLESGSTIVARVQNTGNVEEFVKGDAVMVYWEAEDAHILWF